MTTLFRRGVESVCEGYKETDRVHLLMLKGAQVGLGVGRGAAHKAARRDEKERQPQSSVRFSKLSAWAVTFFYVFYPYPHTQV